MSMHHSRELLFDDTAATEIYTLSLHGALPILAHEGPFDGRQQPFVAQRLRGDCGLRDVVVRAGPRGHGGPPASVQEDRKSTRLNSSHANISYAVFCLKKQNYQKPLSNISFLST